MSRRCNSGRAAGATGTSSAAASLVAGVAIATVAPRSPRAASTPVAAFAITVPRPTGGVVAADVDFANRIAMQRRGNSLHGCVKAVPAPYSFPPEFHEIAGAEIG